MSEIGQGIGRKAQNRRVAGKDPDKRRQILDGAQAVFATRGFDAASMSDIAAAAGVSKSTLYVYFEDKEHLFVALIQQERAAQTQGLFELLEESGHPAATLTRFGERLAELITRDVVVRAHRIVIGVAERMPDLGQQFYEGGAKLGAERLADYLALETKQGTLSVTEPYLAAVQFLDLCQSTLTRPRLLNAKREPPATAEIERVVASAVALFMARYGQAPSAL